MNKITFIPAKLTLLFLFFVSTILAQQAPTLTTFVPARVTQRSVVTINGTNLSGATALNIRFGGILATQVTVVSPTQITAIVGAVATSGPVNITYNYPAGTGYSAGTATTTTQINYVLPGATPTGASATRIITDWNGYWSSTAASATPANQPDTQHNLLGFNYGGIVYSTGVNENTMTTQLGAPSASTYTTGNFKALPISSLTGTVTGSTFLALGTKIDGNAAVKVPTAPGVTGLKIRDVLIDGIQGLGLGTGVTNVASTAVLSFTVGNTININKVTDSEPDILITQIASPSGATDIYCFADTNGNIVGTPLNATLNSNAIPALGTYKVDLFSLTPTNYNDAVLSTATNTQDVGTRDIRMIAFKLSDFGLNADNLSTIATFRIMPGGDSDPAFIAYNANAVTIPAPVITNQPVSQVVCPGTSGSATFTVAATPAGVTYQWRKNGINITTNGTSSSYTIPNVQQSDIAAYDVVVSNVSGSVISNTVYLNTIIAVQPVSAATCIGTPTSIDFIANGASLTYQWYSNTTNSTTGSTLIQGATSNSYLPPVNTAGTRYYYNVITNNGQGCAGATTNIVAVTVSSLSNAGTTSASQTICQGSASTVSVANPVGTIQWQQSSAANGTFTDIPGATSSAYTPNPVLTQTTYFRAVVTSGTCSSAISSPIQVTVNPTSNAGTISASQVICQNSTATVSVANSVGTVQWQQATTANGTYTNVSGGSGANSISYTTPPLTATTYYRAVVTSGTCPSVTSLPTQVTVNAPSNAGVTSGNQTICNNNSATVTVTGAVGTIQWQQSDSANGTYTNVTSGLNATSASYTTPALTATTYYRAAVTNGACTTAYSLPVTVTVLNVNIWEGDISTDWNTAGNWACGIVPTLTTDARIPAVTSPNVYPVITGATGGGFANVKNLTIDANASITITAAGLGNLRIAGTVTNNGILNTLDGTVTFIGTTGAQVVPANVFANNYIRNLTIDNANGVTLNGVLNLTGILTPKTGTFITGNALTLKSNALTTAMIAPVTGSVSGIMTIERYLPGRRAFRFISSPVNGGSIQSNWQEGKPATDPVGLGTDITGAGGAVNGFDVSGSNNPSLFTFDNAGGTSWNAVTSTLTNNLVAGKPMRMLVRGDRTINQALNASLPTNTTLRSTGTIVTGNVIVTDIRQEAGKKSFVGNPYQAPVDMAAVLASATNVNPNFYYIWDPVIGGSPVLGQSGGRGAYVTVLLPGGTNVVSSAANKYLMPNQACFVQTTANGPASLTFKEEYKTLLTNSTPNVYRTGNGNTASIRMALYDEASLALNDTPTDGLLIEFNPEYSNTIDAFDADKMSNQDENLAVLNTDKKLSVERRALPEVNEVLPLFNSQYRKTNYTYVINTENLTGVIALLVDKYLQTTTELTNNSETIYNFAVSETDSLSTAENRFDIVFDQPAMGAKDFTVNDVKVYPNPNNGTGFFIAVPANAEATLVEVYNTLGQVVYANTNIQSGTVLSVQPKTAMAAGIYTVRIKNNGKTAIKKLMIK